MKLPVITHKSGTREGEIRPFLTFFFYFAGINFSGWVFYYVGRFFQQW